MLWKPSKGGRKIIHVLLNLICPRLHRLPELLYVGDVVEVNREGFDDFFMKEDKFYSEDNCSIESDDEILEISEEKFVDLPGRGYAGGKYLTLLLDVGIIYADGVCSFFWIF